MNNEFTFTIENLFFDENYCPSDNTRITTNFANLARGARRQQNVRDALRMINNRFNALAHWDNAKGDRYSVELDIISVNVDVEGKGQSFPIIEILKTNIVDHHTEQRIEGIVGNNFSSYVRDYDFSVVLPNHNKGQKNLAFRITLAIYMASSLKALWHQTASKKTLPSRRLSVCLYQTTKRTNAPETNTLFLGLNINQMKPL